MRLVALKSMKYGTRRLQAGDVFEAAPRDGKILLAVKRAAPHVRDPAEIPAIPERLKAKVTGAELSPLPPETDARASLRAEYEAKFGKRPYMGWSAEELQKRLSPEV